MMKGGSSTSLSYINLLIHETSTPTLLHLNSMIMPDFSAASFVVPPCPAANSIAIRLSLVVEKKVGSKNPAAYQFP